MAGVDITLTRDKNLQTSTPSPCLSSTKIAKYSREQYQKERQFSYGSHAYCTSIQYEIQLTSKDENFDLTNNLLFIYKFSTILTMVL